MAELYIAYPPECPRHGPMKARTGSHGGYTATVYVCPGFDGEGCDYEAPVAEWKHVGWAEDVEVKFTGPLDSPNARYADVLELRLTCGRRPLP